jgi:hypothetical protein
LGAKFFSHRTPGRTGDTGGQVGASEVGPEELDHQQAVVLGALRRAAGAPVSYAELRQAGVEFPASVVSELELAGIAIQRCLGDGRGAVGVRLDPANDSVAPPTPDRAKRPMPTDAKPEPAWSSVRICRASSVTGQSAWHRGTRRSECRRSGSPRAECLPEPCYGHETRAQHQRST